MNGAPYSQVKTGFTPCGGPVLEPVGQFLDRGEVRVEIARVHRAEVARGVVVDDAARVEALHDRLGPQGELGVVRGPRVARVVDAVDHVRVHVLAVAGGVVAHGVEHDRRMVLRGAHVELGVAGVAVVLVGVGRLPVVVAEVRLGEGDEHPHVVRGPQDLREAQVGARLAAVVVRVDEVDAEALQAQQALLRAPRRWPARRRPGRCPAGRRRGRCGCRSGRSPGRRSRTRGSRSARHGRCPAPCRRRPAARAGGRYMFCGVWMSQSFSGFHFSVKAMRPSLRSLPLERLAGELLDAACPVVHDPGAQGVLRARRQGPASAASKVISPLRTEVSTFTSAMRAPGGVLTR